MEDKQVCGALTVAGEACQHPAGWGTSHLGEGRCKYHGGKAGRPSENGNRIGERTKNRLRSHVERHLQDADPTDLSNEIALIRGYIDTFQDAIERRDSDPSAEEAGHLQGLLDCARRLADTMNKIQTRTALTSFEAAALVIGFARALEEIEDVDERERIWGVFTRFTTIAQTDTRAGILERWTERIPALDSPAGE